MRISHFERRFLSQVICFHLSVQGCQADSQFLSRNTLVLMLSQTLANDFRFCFFKVSIIPVYRRRLLRFLHQNGRSDLVSQQLRAQYTRGWHHIDRKLNGVLEFPHIPRPAVLLQCFPEILADFSTALIHGHTEFSDKASGNQADISCTVPAGAESSAAQH